MSFSYWFCPWPSYQPSICLCVLTILKSICRSLSLTSLRLYQSLASHSPKIASRWCTPRSRRGLSQPSHMCWASWYLLWVRRWALDVVVILVFIWLSGSSVSVCALCSWINLLVCFSVSFSLLVLGLHGYFHDFYCVFSVISNWKKGICGNSWTSIGYAENEGCYFCWIQLSSARHAMDQSACWAVVLEA